MGKLERFLGKGEEIEIEGEKLLIKPLTTDSLGDFFKIAKAFSGMKANDDVAKFITNLDDNSLKAMQNMLDKTLQLSFPEDSEQSRKEFGMKYMMILLPVIFEMNGSSIDNKSKQVQDKLAELQRGPDKQD